MKLNVLIAIAGLGLASCADPASGPAASAPTPPPTGMATAPDAPPSEPPMVVGMANPASVHCGEVGGRSEIRDGADGQYGVCVFEDGRQCEEWTLLQDGVCTAPAVAPDAASLSEG